MDLKDNDTKIRILFELLLSYLMKEDAIDVWYMDSQVNRDKVQAIHQSLIYPSIIDVVDL